MMEQVKKVIQKAGPVKLGIVVLCGVFLMMISWNDTAEVTEETEKTNFLTTENSLESETTLEQYKKTREEELEGLLKEVEGVGNVEVMLTLHASQEKVTLKDNATKGENSEEKTVLVENENRDSLPYVVQEKEPELEGVVIVCDGGSDAFVKREITDAVSALFSIESHKIKIMKSKEAKE